MNEDDAARAVQRIWRRHQDITLFRKLKELVNFRNQGNPATLLRVINPVEAQLLDAAVGAHVRFRLGGIEWPPQIYYKIFLHSPVCDVNSYAPRNYADRENEGIGPVTPEEVPQFTEEYGWYKRIENNGWRPISSLSPAAVDLITSMTNKPIVSAAKVRKRKNLKKEVAKLKLKRFLEMKNREVEMDGRKITEDDFDDEEIMKRMMVEKRTPGAPVPTVSGMFAKVWKEEGVTGFFKGLSINMVKIIPYSALQYTIYGETKKALLRWKENKQLAEKKK